jgi:hypothetical protein
MGLCQKNMAAHFKERKKTLSPQSIRQYLLQLAKGLEYLHRQGIVHRDLKQDNICFGPDGKLKLVDLGLATQFKGEGMKSQYMSTLFKPRGHIAYQAPESRKQNVSIDGKSDVWSLGLIIAEMLCGWFIQDCPGHEHNEPNQNEKMRKFIIAEAKKKDSVLGKLVFSMLQPKVTTRWTSKKLVKELEKIGLKEIEGRVVDTGFARQTPKAWIDNLQNRPVKSLELSLQGVDNKFKAGKGEALAFANGLAVAKRGKLSVDEAAAINLYTQNCLYRKLNQVLRSQNAEEREPFLDFTRLLLFALNKLPDEAETTFFRLVNRQLNAEYGNGKQFFWSAFSSCSTVDTAVMQFAKKSKPHTIFAIAGCGKSIAEYSAYKSENEILIPMTVELCVQNSFQNGKTTTVFLKMVESAAGKRKKRKRDDHSRAGPSGTAKKKKPAVSLATETDDEANELFTGSETKKVTIDWGAVKKVVGKKAADQMKQGEGFTGTLDLSDKSITAEGCRTIAPALRTMPNLKKLWLNRNNIGDEGLAVLSNVVPAIPMLYSLGLYGNKIGNVGCQCLLELIENDSLQSLTCLHLRFNPNISSELKTKVKRVWSEKGKKPNELYI